MEYQPTTMSVNKKFRIPKINFLDPATFNVHRRKISTDYYYALERAHERFKSKRAILQHEYDVILQDIRSAF